MACSRQQSSKADQAPAEGAAQAASHQTVNCLQGRSICPANVYEVLGVLKSMQASLLTCPMQIHSPRSYWQVTADNSTGQVSTCRERNSDTKLI
jgi:hypothetical protein